MNGNWHNTVSGWTKCLFASISRYWVQQSCWGTDVSWAVEKVGNRPGLYCSEACHRCPEWRKMKKQMYLIFAELQDVSHQNGQQHYPGPGVTSWNAEIECLTIIFCGYKSPNEPGKDITCGIFHWIWTPPLIGNVWRVLVMQCVLFFLAARLNPALSPFSQTAESFLSKIPLQPCMSNR